MFDDEEETDEQPTTSYEGYQHDVDTPIEELVAMQTMQAPSQRPRKVMMNVKTWRSLSKNDQTAWDALTDNGKKSILEYAANRSIQSGNPSHPSSTAS